jgi:hypothetical protein
MPRFPVMGIPELLITTFWNKSYIRMIALNTLLKYYKLETLQVHITDCFFVEVMGRDAGHIL